VGDRDINNNEPQDEYDDSLGDDDSLLEDNGEPTPDEYKAPDNFQPAHEHRMAADADLEESNWDDDDEEEDEGDAEGDGHIDHGASFEDGDDGYDDYDGNDGEVDEDVEGAVFSPAGPGSRPVDSFRY